jgi:hypothetical protein
MGAQMQDPWAFGWTQLLGVGGLLLTAVIGGIGLRTLNKWRREKIEEKKIDLAMDAIALAYESKGVFEAIRSPVGSKSEYDDMEVIPDEEPTDRSRRGTYYARMKRIQSYRAFFERAYAMQPRCTALFGVEAEEVFLQLHMARNHIEVACQMLTHDIKQPENHEDLWFQLRDDMGARGLVSKAKEPDRVGQMLERFREGVEATLPADIGGSAIFGRSLVGRVSPRPKNALSH